MARVLDNPTQCGVTAMISVVGGRWKPIILWVLASGTKRFGQLSVLVPGISRKILTEQLKELETDGLVTRVSFNETPPRVDYSLTQKADTLKPILKSMCLWGEQNVLAGKKRRRINRNAKS